MKKPTKIVLEGIGIFGLCSLFATLYLRKAMSGPWKETPPTEGKYYPPNPYSEGVLSDMFPKTESTSPSAEELDRQSQEILKQVEKTRAEARK